MAQQTGARNIKMPTGMTMQIGKDGSQNYYMKGGGSYTTTSSNPMNFMTGASKQPPVVTKKIVDNQFNITDSTFGSLAIGNKGPTNFKSKMETFDKGAENQNIDIKGGVFNQANIGGEATYKNKDSTIATGGIGGTLWNYDVEGVVLKLLKSGLTTEHILKGLLAKRKLQDMEKIASQFAGKKLPLMFDSWLISSPEDMEAS